MVVVVVVVGGGGLQGNEISTHLIYLGLLLLLTHCIGYITMGSFKCKGN